MNTYDNAISSLPNNTEYVPDQRVVGIGPVYGGMSGVVVKATKSSVTVRWDGSPRNARIHYHNLAPETAEYVAMRCYNAGTKDWLSRQPRTALTYVKFANYISSEDGVGMHYAKTPGEMRQAAEELKLLADWFEKRPVLSER